MSYENGFSAAGWRGRPHSEGAAPDMYGPVRTTTPSAPYEPLRLICSIAGTHSVLLCNGTHIAPSGPAAAIEPKAIVRRQPTTPDTPAASPADEAKLNAKRTYYFKDDDERVSKIVGKLIVAGLAEDPDFKFLVMRATRASYLEKQESSRSIVPTHTSYSIQKCGHSYASREYPTGKESYCLWCSNLHDHEMYSDELENVINELVDYIDDNEIREKYKEYIVSNVVEESKISASFDVMGFE